MIIYVHIYIYTLSGIFVLPSSRPTSTLLILSVGCASFGGDMDNTGQNN